MLPPPAHIQFERQVERIHQLLEPDGSEITWNDHIPDPDKPDQPRQVDVLIRREGQRTLVECRFHKAPQDVTWIEELMGRRLSLEADSVIAVSASGFTATARQKAVRHGIVLRDLATLSPMEVQSWGRKRQIFVSYCEFSFISFNIAVDIPPGNKIPRITGFGGRPLDITWRRLFQDIMHRLEQAPFNAPITVNSELKAPLLVNGNIPSAVSCHARVRRRLEPVSLVSVLAYADPVTSTIQAEVGKFAVGGSEIIEDGDRLSMVIDMGQIPVPDRCCFDTVTVDAGRVVKARPMLIGYENAVRCKIPIQYNVQYHDPEKGLTIVVVPSEVVMPPTPNNEH